MIFCSFPLTTILMLQAQITPGQPGEAPLQVSGPRIVFFSPTRAERDSIVQAEGLEIDDYLDDFQLSSGKAAVYAGAYKIPVDFTTSQIILVKIGKNTVRRVDRKTVPGLMGMLLTDGNQEPKIYPGVIAWQELIPEINDFFQIK
jgi:hypothetical protein